MVCVKTSQTTKFDLTLGNSNTNLIPTTQWIV